jgi:catechol 2,3-dioxygenase-like lactoylglutathione lyase family enzyme
MGLRGIDHVQLAMPRGGEPAARSFYADLLGLAEVPKPPELAGRGGCWFESGAVKLHVGVDDDFRPARKAHPALVADDLATLVDTLTDAGFDVVDATGAGRRRAYVHDPFGNRLELLADES